MNPVAFEIFGVAVRWYGVIISGGLLIAALVAMKEAKRLGFYDDIIIDLLIFALPAAIIGARLYYVIFMWDYYSQNTAEIFRIRSGGLAIHGAIIAAAIVGAIFARFKGVSFRKLADACAPSIILGQAIGRWGNFVNQEAHGGPTDLPWGIMIDGQKVHPTFLYESLWNFAVFAFLLWYGRNRVKARGEVFVLYTALYSVGRFFIEGLRTDSLMLGPFRVAQLISLIIICAAIIIFIWLRKSNKNNVE